MIKVDSIEELICDDHVEFCSNLDRSLLQESFSWRCATLARKLALLLIDGTGKLQEPLLKRVRFLLEAKGYSLLAERHHEAVFMEHLLKQVCALVEEGDLIDIFRKIKAPSNNPIADRVIRQTLHLTENTPIKEYHAKQAALAALLCHLRQNVGSCFATAPAIRIQAEEPYQLLVDIDALFGTSRLRRVVEGLEYTVPFSTSFGVGNLLKPLFLSTLGPDVEAILESSLSLIIPLERASIIDRELSLKEKQKVMKELLKKSGIVKGVQKEFVMTSADEMLQKLLQAHFKITTEDIEKYQGTLKSHAHFSLLGGSQLPKGSKSIDCERYLQAYAAAKNGFITMTDNALLKAWEFTLASLSESQADFAGWNLSVALGLNPEEPYGIGQILYEEIQKKIEILNREVEEMQGHYEQLFTEVKYIESRSSRATEEELKWLTADYRGRKMEIDRILQKRDDAYNKSVQLKELFSFLLHFYREKCKEYFQEIYDPEMHDLTPSLYDDSPAGFRLLYKHGRSNPSAWSLIYTPEQYIDFLSAFFIATEVALTHAPEVEGVKGELSQLVTAVVLGIKREEFIISSFHRLSRAYNESTIADPLAQLDFVKRKPWAYVSGGTMTTLIRCYYGRSTPPKEESRWVENETELFAFYLDTLKSLPTPIQKRYLEDKEASMLAFSPTHAFLLKPGYSLFAEGWQTDSYSYSWIRDVIVNPAVKFIASIQLDREMMASLSQNLSKSVPMGYRALVQKKLSELKVTMAPFDYAKGAKEILSYEKWLRGGAFFEISDTLDQLLYESVPFSFAYELQDKVSTLCKEIDTNSFDKVSTLARKEQEERGRYQLITAKELLEITKRLFMEARESTRIDFDLHKALLFAMQKREWAMKAPVLFADTNWVKNYFGFCVNPGSGQLELWRFDYCGSNGRPMSIWKKYLNGSEKGSWGLYTNPIEYT